MLSRFVFLSLSLFLSCFLSSFHSILTRNHFSFTHLLHTLKQQLLAVYLITNSIYSLFPRVIYRFHCFFTSSFDNEELRIRYFSTLFLSIFVIASVPVKLFEFILNEYHRLFETDILKFVCCLV